MDAVLKLLLDLYHGASERPLDGFQDFALDLVKPVLQFDAARWGGANIEGGTFAPHAVHLHNDPEESIDDWAEFFDIDTFATETAQELGRAKNVHIPTHYVGKRYAGIRDYAHKYGHENAMAIALSPKGSRLLNWVALYRADPDCPFTGREERICEALAPHLLTALGINRTICLEKLDAPGDWRRPSFAMADRRGMLWYAEPEFNRLIGAEWPAWREPALPKPLADGLNAAGRFAGQGLLVTAAPLGKLLLLRARPLCAIDRLTSREFDVALAYSRGQSAKAVARQLGISPATVHHHLRIAYDKLGVDNKASLALLFAGLDPQSQSPGDADR
jgi:DNA-binding CsgD family transcriptional regulator